MPIVHDLIKHFVSVNINWIGREHNVEADKVSKESASRVVGFDENNPDFFKITFI